METIGDRIRHMRNSLGMTQTDLANKLGVKTNAVSKWELDHVKNIPMEKIREMSKIFDVPITFLVLDSDDECDMTVGEKLFAFCEQKGFSIESLAQKTGIPELRLRNIEEDIVKPNIDELKELCQSLELEDISMLMNHADCEIFEAGKAYAQSIAKAGDSGDISALMAELRMGNYTFSTAERQLIKEFAGLNDTGKSIAVGRVSELSEIPRYQAEHRKYHR